MNALQIVNSVLRRLREPEITDFSESYPKMILDFVNETKREVEDSWDWLALRKTISVNTNTVNTSYSLTGAGNRYRFTHSPYTKNISVYNVTQNCFLSLVNSSNIISSILLTIPQSAAPSKFAVIGQDASGDPVVSFDTKPDRVYVINFDLVIPQAELVNTTDSLSVPWYPVVQGAWARAISERGEDGGQNTSEQYQMYAASLSDAIAQDVSRTGGEVVWSQV